MRALLLILALALTPSAGVSAPKDPEPIPADVAKVWKAASARPGMIELSFGNTWLEDKREYLGDGPVVPGFLMWSWKKGELAKLPAPEKPFGLMCYQPIRIGISRESSVSDTDLKELATFKHLTTLSLWGTRVTDAGLKELAAIESLTTLNLRKTKITDAGLKELASFNRLSALSLRETQVTDTGLKDLVMSKSITTLDLGYTRVTDMGLLC
jgi:hypothetical protein